MPRPLIALIDIDAMRANLNVAKARAPQAKAWAVVKSNAYGHGLQHAAEGFSEADGMALIEPEAAQRLRELGWHKPILLLEGCFDAADLETARRQNLDIVVHCEEQLRMLELAPRSEVRLKVHLKMNSGMNRLGFRPEQFAAVHARLSGLNCIRAIAMLTHFANADEEYNPALPMTEQVRRFNEGTRGLAGERSLCNSAADLLHPELAADWIRPGIMLYGATPGLKTAESFGLVPAMTLRSALIGVQQIHRGEAVGYGSRFVAEEDMRVGVVACGYADGYPRHAGTGAPVLVDGVRTRTLGRISMDMMAVDLSAVPDAHVGTPVTLWGQGLPIDEVAGFARTIGYELMCAVAPRVPLIRSAPTASH